MRQVLGLFLCLVFFCGCAGAAPEQGSSPGKMAYPFSVKTTTGKPFDLSQHRGKVVILHWWATWCKPCLEEWPEIKKLLKSWKGNQKVVFVGLALDEPGPKVKRYMATHGLGFIGGLDKGEAVFQRYEIPGLPYTVVVDQKGKVAMRSLKTGTVVQMKVNQLLKGP